MPSSTDAAYGTIQVDIESENIINLQTRRKKIFIWLLKIYAVTIVIGIVVAVVIIFNINKVVEDDNESLLKDSESQVKEESKVPWVLIMVFQAIPFFPGIAHLILGRILEGVLILIFVGPGSVFTLIFIICGCACLCSSCTDGDGTVMGTLLGTCIGTLWITAYLATWITYIVIIANNNLLDSNGLAPRGYP